MNYTPEQILKKIGLDKRESDLYLSCLSVGGMSVTGLKRKTGLARTTIYDLLSKLELKGYITKAKRNQTKIFYAVSIQELIVLMQDKVVEFEKKKDLLQSNIPEFQELMIGTNLVPYVKMYEGSDALSIIFGYIKKSSMVRTFYSAEITEKNLGKEIVMDVHGTHQQSKVPKKILLINDAYAKEEKKKLESKGFEVKIAPKGKNMASDLIILDDKVYMLVYGEKTQALEIVQPVFVHTQRLMFDMIWENIDNSK